ncbi:DEKNAAC102283 [Brettanomyces naardenensis]|uniref:Protein arginine methyltransferase NDUFAF7 n=1 Tax=Brettanomyces naardenensis TaxID=13370 RepID=A0A448YK09_BRENA|nr:DEKNAAC102283 [Brettanomyces naardenensis]
MQYRLPTDEELKEGPKSHSNLVKYVFEQGGVESLDWSTNKSQFDRYPTTDSGKLMKRKKRPKGVRLLSADFIEDSLYNPTYGYFSREVVIFQPDKPFNYQELKGRDDFMEHWLKAYEKYDKERVASLSQGTKGGKTKPMSAGKITGQPNTQLEKPSLQLWHTPTELFQPYYGEALAKYILVNYKLNQYPYNDLIIYEVGAGNGTLMLNILDFLEKNEPEVYKRTKYKIIEISSKLFNKQNSRLTRHLDKVEVINKSIFDWDTPVNEPCFFIALEVFDNFAHDVVRYDINTNRPYQGYVVIDEHNDFKEFYSPELDTWTAHFLNSRELSATPISSIPEHPINQFSAVKKLKNAFDPLRNGLTDPEYVPTRLVKLFEILKAYFPNHQLLASDFSTLDKAIKGYNAPVVQTMYQDNMVNVDSYMCDQGYFDIMFPTDFNVINSLYTQIVGKISNTCSHEDFLKVWGDVDATTTKSGENPMLELYSNASFIYS